MPKLRCAKLVALSGSLPLVVGLAIRNIEWQLTRVGELLPNIQHFVGSFVRFSLQIGGFALPLLLVAGLAVGSIGASINLISADAFEDRERSRASIKRMSRNRRGTCVRTLSGDAALIDLSGKLLTAENYTFLSRYRAVCMKDPPPSWDLRVTSGSDEGCLYTEQGMALLYRQRTRRTVGDPLFKQYWYVNCAGAPLLIKAQKTAHSSAQSD